MDEAYIESLNDNPEYNEFVIDPVAAKNSEPECKDCEKNTPENPEQSAYVLNPETEYRRSLYNKMAARINEPNTPPIAKPPKQLRILFVNRKSPNNRVMYGDRYAYFFVGEPEWVLAE